MPVTRYKALLQEDKKAPATLELKKVRVPGIKNRIFERVKFACCDCSLVHEFQFALEDNGNLGMALRRDFRATANRRRSKAMKGLRLPK